MATPSRFPSGLSTQPKGNPLGNYGMPDPTKYYTYFNDFTNYTAANWTVTAVGGATAEALVVGDNGLLQITSDTGATDGAFLELPITSFTFIAGKKLWFKTRFALSDANTSAAVVGLQVVDTTPLAVANGVYFLKPTAATALNLLATASSVSTTQLVTQMVNATFVEVGFEYDGKSKIKAFLGANQIAALPITNLPSASLTLSFGFQNGAAAAKNMQMDYLFVSRER